MQDSAVLSIINRDINTLVNAKFSNQFKSLLYFLSFQCIYYFAFIYSVVEKPDLINLQSFPFDIEGSKNIIARVAVQYKCIGAVLLNDKDGTIIAGLTASNEPRDITYNIFQKWVCEDTECSWPKLIKCMRQCELSALAKQIEDALQLKPQHKQGL